MVLLNPTMSAAAESLPGEAAALGLAGFIGVY